MAKETYWTCSNCHDQVEEVYDVCWNCQYDREGNLRVDFTEGEIIDDRSERRALTEKHKPKNCLHCKTLLRHIETKQFIEGIRLGTISDLLELVENRLELEMYYCPQCRRVEFFYFGPS